MKNVLAAVFLVGLLIVSHAATAKDWRVVHTYGFVHLVVIPKDKEKDFSLYQNAIDTLCQANRHCAVQFWSDERQVPAGSLGKMTDEQLEKRVAAYLNNPSTGLRSLTYHCRIKADPKFCPERMGPGR